MQSVDQLQVETDTATSVMKAYYGMLKTVAQSIGQ